MQRLLMQPLLLGDAFKPAGKLTNCYCQVVHLFLKAHICINVSQTCTPLKSQRSENIEYHGQVVMPPVIDGPALEQKHAACLQLQVWRMNALRIAGERSPRRVTPLIRVSKATVLRAVIKIWRGKLQPMACCRRAGWHVTYLGYYWLLRCMYLQHLSCCKSVP